MSEPKQAQTTRCFVCGDEQWVSVVPRGEPCQRILANKTRCCGRYVGLYEPRPDFLPPPPKKNRS